MIFDFRKYFNRVDVTPKKKELPADVDTEGTPESRKKAKDLMLKADGPLYNKLVKMRADKQVRDSKKKSSSPGIVNRQPRSSAEAAGVKVGLGVHGKTGAF